MAESFQSARRRSGYTLFPLSQGPKNYSQETECAPAGETGSFDRMAQNFLNRGINLLKMGEREAAVVAVKQAIRCKSDLPDAYCVLGLALEAAGRDLEAVTALKEAIALRPDSPKAHYNLGIIYFKLGHYQEALEACRQAIRLDPEDFMAHSALGAIYFDACNFSQAAQAFGAAVKLKPQYASGHLGLCMSYLRLTDKCSAMKELEILQGMDYGLAHLFEKVVSSAG